MPLQATSLTFLTSLPPHRLIGLKNIFSKQLPNMPKEYIARLVLDRRHRSVAIIRRGGMVRHSTASFAMSLNS